LANIRRVLDNNGYYPFGGEKEVVDYIESVAVNADQRADNFVRSKPLQ
jgi:hypothetical protein